jgi:hypothetical protein
MSKIFGALDPPWMSYSDSLEMVNITEKDRELGPPRSKLKNAVSSCSLTNWSKKDGL